MLLRACKPVQFIAHVAKTSTPLISAPIGLVKSFHSPPARSSFIPTLAKRTGREATGRMSTTATLIEQNLLEILQNVDWTTTSERQLRAALAQRVGQDTVDGNLPMIKVSPHVRHAPARAMFT